MTTVESYQFKLFLEGVEVPNAAWQANIACQANTHARCTLSMVPVPIARNVLPRTLVHLFWHDREDWRAIFCGEVTGRGIEEGHDSRNIVYHCKSFSSYWDHCYRAYYDESQQMPTISSKNLNISVQSTDKSNTTVLVNTFLRSAFVLSPAEDTAKGSRETSTPAGRVAKDIDEGILAILDKMVEINAFFRHAHNRLDLVSRNYVLNNKFTSRLLTNFVNASSFSLDSQTGPLATLTDLFRVLFPMVFFQFVPLTSPAMISGRRDKLHQSTTGATIPVEMLLLPELDFAPPPWCNVIYPDQYIHFSFDEDFMAAPTRSFFFEGAIVGKDTTYTTYSAPYKNIDGETIFGGKTVIQYDSKETGKPKITNSQTSQVLFREEMLKGAVFSQQYIQGRDTIFGPGTEETVVAEFRQDLAKITNYRHFKNRAASRSIPNVSMRFNPYLVAGLPALLLYRYGPFLGTVGTYTHTISGKGHARTSCQLHHVRMPDLDKKWNETDMNGPPPFYYAHETGEFTGRPIWYDDNLGTRNIGETFYKKALAVDSIMSVETDEDMKKPPETLHDAVKLVHTAFFSEARHEYIRNQTRRPIPTAKEVFAAIGVDIDSTNRTEGVAKGYVKDIQFASQDNVNAFVDRAKGKPFMHERHTWARDLAKAYRQVVNEEGRG